MITIKERGCYRHVSKRAFNQKWKDLGYEIVEEESNDIKEENKDQATLEDYTVVELREIAKELDMTGYYSLKKDDLIDKIKKVR